MKKQKKQNLLTAIIILLVIVLSMLVSSIVYEEMINMNKQTQNTLNPTINKDEENNSNKENEITDKQDETQSENEDETQGENENLNEVEEEKIETTDKEQEYVGKEESNSQEETTENKDNKAIQLVKKEWGEDKTVTFSIEKKNGTKYRVAVRDNSTTVLAWYEVDIETWEVNEY